MKRGGRGRVTGTGWVRGDSKLLKEEPWSTDSESAHEDIRDFVVSSGDAGSSRSRDAPISDTEDDSEADPGRRTDARRRGAKHHRFRKTGTAHNQGRVLAKEDQAFIERVRNRQLRSSAGSSTRSTIPTFVVDSSESEDNQPCVPASKAKRKRPSNDDEMVVLSSSSSSEVSPVRSRRSTAKFRRLTAPGRIDSDSTDDEPDPTTLKPVVSSYTPSRSAVKRGRPLPPGDLLPPPTNKPSSLSTRASTSEPHIRTSSPRSVNGLRTAAEKETSDEPEVIEID